MLSKPSDWNKLNNVTLNDIGMGNIKVSTAIDLLNNYAAAHPNSDPLKLKYLQKDYAKLVDRLIDPADNASVIFAGLMIQEGSNLV